MSAFLPRARDDAHYVEYSGRQAERSMDGCLYSRNEMLLTASVTRSWEISQIWEILGVDWDKILISWDVPKLGFLISSKKASVVALR